MIETAEVKYVSPMKKKSKNTVTKDIVGSRDHDQDHPGSTEISEGETLLSQACNELDAKINFIQMQLKKLEVVKSHMIKQYQQVMSEKMKEVVPLVDYVFIEAESRQNRIKDIKIALDEVEQHIQQEHQVLEELIQNESPSIQQISSQTGTKPRKSHENSPLYSSSKAEEIEQNLNELLSRSVGGVEKSEKSEKSEFSGSLTSEHKSMIQKMSAEEREAYQSKQIKNRMMMAKLKKRK